MSKINKKNSNIIIQVLSFSDNEDIKKYNNQVHFLLKEEEKFKLKDNIHILSKYLNTIGLDNYQTHIHFQDNDSNETVQILAVLPKTIQEEINNSHSSDTLSLFSKLQSTISKIINNIKNSNTKQNFFCDISEFDEKLQKIILDLFLEQNYQFKKYKENNFEENNNSNFEQSKNKIPSLEIITSLDNKIISQTLLLNSNISYCKDLINSNADEITSEYLHKELEEFSREHSLKFKSIVGEELLNENMNLHYQVGKSAQIPPRMLYAIYKGDSISNSYTVLVGKGVTFDTGGINLKPTGAIEDMKLDMGGAATTFSVFKTLVEMKTRKNIILVLGCCENSIDSKSYKPGDVYISRKGISVEITNTDAEGRLVLADCMNYIQDNYNVEELIDCATLTGASMIALGLKTIAMFSNDNTFARNIYSSSKITYELMWRLPIFDEHREVLKSNIAHCSNCGSGALRKFGGASSAAAFLEKFIEKDVRWVHLDIAGASYNSKTGATGAGIKTLVHYISKSS